MWVLRLVLNLKFASWHAVSHLRSSVLKCALVEDLKYKQGHACVQRPWPGVRNNKCTGTGRGRWWNLIFSVTFPFKKNQSVSLISQRYKGTETRWGRRRKWCDVYGRDVSWRMIKNQWGAWWVDYFMRGLWSMSHMFHVLHGSIH